MSAHRETGILDAVMPREKTMWGNTHMCGECHMNTKQRWIGASTSHRMSDWQQTSISREGDMKQILLHSSRKNLLWWYPELGLLVSRTARG